MKHSLLKGTFLAALLTIGANAMAVDFTVDGIAYNILTTNTAQVAVNDNGYSGEVVIPATVTNNGTTYNVTSIAHDAFYYENITTITIGANVSEIADRAFGDDESLETIIVDPANKWFVVANDMLLDIDQTRLIVAPGLITEAVIPNTVKTICTSCFEYCTELQTVTMSTSLETMETDAFYHCDALTSIWLPKTFVNYTIDALYGCVSMTSIEVEEGNPQFSSADGLMYNVDKSILWKVPNGLHEISILPSVKTIYDSAIYGVKRLTNLELPNAVEEVQDYGCDYIVDLETLKIGSGLKNYGLYAFAATDYPVTVTCLAPVPPTNTSDDTPFEDDTYNNGALFVPEASIDAYKADAWFGKFVNIQAYTEPAAEYTYAATIELLTPSAHGIPDQWLEGLKVKITNTGKTPIAKFFRTWSCPELPGIGNGWSKVFDPAIQPGESVECDMWNIMTANTMSDGTYNCQFILEKGDGYALENPAEERTCSFTLVVGNQDDAIVPPYFNNFTADDAIEGWTLIDGNGDDDLWTQEDGYLKAPYNDDIPMDDWIFTPAFSFEGGMSYPFSVDVRINKEVYAPEKMEILYGAEPTVEGMTQQIMEPTEFSSNTWATYSYTLAPATTGLYYIGLHCITDPDKTQLHVTNFTVGAPSTTGVENIIGSDTQAVYYDLTGRMVEHPQPGNIYIKKAGNKATKIIL